MTVWSATNTDVDLNTGIDSSCILTAKDERLKHRHEKSRHESLGNRVFDSPNYLDWKMNV